MNRSFDLHFTVSLMGRLTRPSAARRTQKCSTFGLERVDGVPASRLAIPPCDTVRQSDLRSLSTGSDQKAVNHSAPPVGIWEANEQPVPFPDAARSDRVLHKIRVDLVPTIFGKPTNGMIRSSDSGAFSRLFLFRLQRFLMQIALVFLEARSSGY